MSYRIICFTKILTLAIAPFLFILVGVVCEFAIVPGVYILLSPQEEGYRKTNSAAHLSKIGLLLSWKKKYKKGIPLCYDVCKETKRHFEISIYF